MNDKKEDKTITLTEDQLERIIKSAVKNALRELKEEEKLPGNIVDELKSAPVTFSLIYLVYVLCMGLFIAIFLLAVVAILNLMCQNGFSFGTLSVGLCFLFLAFLFFVSILEVSKTKRIDVLNTVFSAIIALVGLIVAIVGTVFAYKSLK